MESQSRAKGFGPEAQSLKAIVFSKKWSIAAACVLSFLAQLMGVIPFVVIYCIVVAIAEQGNSIFARHNIWLLVASAGAAVFLRYFFAGFASYFSHNAAYAILHDLRLAIAEKLASLPLGYFNHTTTGGLKKVLLEDTEKLEVFLGHNLPDFIGVFFYMLLSLLLLFYMSWQLALVTICLLPVAFLAQAFTLKRNKTTIEAVYTAVAKSNAAIVQYVHGLPVIKAFGKTDQSFQKYADSVNEGAALELFMCGKWALPMSIYSVVVNGSGLLVLPAACYLYLAGDLGLPTLVVFLLVGLGIGGTLHQFMTLGNVLAQQMEGRKRISALLNTPSMATPEKPDTPKNHSITADNVSFTYGNAPVLQNISFTLCPGHFLALVGPTGAGKSTLAKLIPRFWDVSGGSLQIGEVSVCNIQPQVLMENVSFVFQHSFLFTGSIKENILMGKPLATQMELEHAAKAACCHEFIQNLPEKYNTHVGDGGGTLSGGEQQRICIARAILKDAPIVVLDEATAFIDPENEVYIQRALTALVRGKVLVVVAHRLSTITGADEILVLDKGRIAARGSHAELLKSSPLYTTLWEAHMAGKDCSVSLKEGN